jgi:tyrosinase
MRILLPSVILIVCGYAAAVPAANPSVARVLGQHAPALPISAFETTKYARPLSLMDAVLGRNASITTIDHDERAKRLMAKLNVHKHHHLTMHDIEAKLERLSTTASNSKRQNKCTSVRTRVEWDSFPNADKQAFLDSIKCLMRAPPSGAFAASENRYEDIVVLHQTMTPLVHGNALFLLWHRYLLWTFEDLLRQECDYKRSVPWFDESQHAGHFENSTVFSRQWLGTIMANGECVQDGQFAMLASNIGPGPDNTRHCLSRNGDESKTANTKQSLTDACNARTGFADMAACTEGAAHAWGHNGVGAVMQDVYASPADPFFWLHHAYIDRNFGRWQDVDPTHRTSSVAGVDSTNRNLAMGTVLIMGGIRDDVRIRDVLDIETGKLCYRYSS